MKYIDFVELRFASCNWLRRALRQLADRFVDKNFSEWTQSYKLTSRLFKINFPGFKLL